MYFHTDNDNVVQHLANDLMAACANRQKVRITVDGYGRLRYKVGEGMWTGPIDSTPDPYRDTTCNRQCPETPENMHPDAQHYLGCRIWDIHSEKSWNKMR